MTRGSLFARWSNHQLSRLELVMAVIVLLVLVSVFLNHMVTMLARAERSMIERSIVNLNSALRVQTYIDKEPGRIDAMRHANPVRLLERQPDWKAYRQLGSEQLAALARARSAATLPNYAGEMDGGDAADLEPGNWYFDTGSRALVYIVRNAEVFRSDLPGRARLRYRLELDYEDRNGDGRFTPGVDRFHDPGLRPLDEYQWLF